MEASSERQAADFVEEAEAARRSGSPERAAQLARAGLAEAPGNLGGHIALALALLECGEPEEAARVLAGALEAPDLAAGSETVPAPVDDAELEAAFASARPERDSMLGADDVARAALAQVDDDEPEAPEVEPLETTPFATQTMASLLERQGNNERASALRERIVAEREEARRQTIVRLEAFLERVMQASRMRGVEGGGL